MAHFVKGGAHRNGVLAVVEHATGFEFGSGSDNHFLRIVLVVCKAPFLGGGGSVARACWLELPAVLGLMVAAEEVTGDAAASFGFR